MRRAVIVFALFLACTMSTPAQTIRGVIARPADVPEQDWKLAAGKPTNDKDLRCIDGGRFIGGIDRAWYLVITGPPRNRFYYHFMDAGDTKSVEGTYEVKDGLAHFSGTLTIGPGFAQKGAATSQPVRFALNYRHVAGQVQFNVLSRDDTGTYRYERHWFQRADTGWRPREHRRLSFTPKKQTQTQLIWEVRGEWIRWGAKANTKDTQLVAHTAVYVKEQDHWRRADGQPDWLPEVLHPHGEPAKDGEPAVYHVAAPQFGWVRGFTFDEPPAR